MSNGTTSKRHNFLTPEILKKLSPNSLNRNAFMVYSQFGEDGIIEEIFRRLNINNGFFIEFGAYDGMYLSNTRYLWEKGWSGVMIEASPTLFEQLKENYKEAKNVLCLHEFVTPEDNNPQGPTLDKIAEKYFPEQEVDFLVIDIDGLDFEIFKNLKIRPKVISIECNLFWHPLFTKEVPAAVSSNNLQQPLAVVIELARSKGYEPVCQTINLFLVRRDLYAPFKDTPSDTLTLWRDGFRSNPTKDWTWDYRQKSKTIKEYEDPELEIICPITKDF